MLPDIFFFSGASRGAVTKFLYACFIERCNFVRERHGPVKSILRATDSRSDVYITPLVVLKAVLTYENWYAKVYVYTPAIFALRHI